MTESLAHGEIIATLRRLREQRGWSLRDLAERLDVSAAAVCYWERGTKVPSLINATAWAAALNCSFELHGDAA